MEVLPVLGISDIIQRTQNLQSKLAAITVAGSAGGDMVTVEANGSFEILSVKIEKELMTGEDHELLEDLVMAAVNDALTKAKDKVSEEVSKITGGLRIPGLS
jgi:nucleoid-associated protein EbfC